MICAKVEAPTLANVCFGEGAGTPQDLECGKERDGILAGVGVASVKDSVGVIQRRRFGSDTPAWINVLSVIVERCRPSTDGAAEREVTGSNCKGSSRSTMGHTAASTHSEARRVLPI